MEKNIVLILGSFHKEEVTIMLEKAKKTAKDLNLNIVKEIWVPGSMEKPLILKKCLLKQEIDGAVVLGIIEKGETKHGLVMGQAVINSIINLQVELSKPVGTAILGPEILPSQINSRLEPYAEKAIRALAKMFETLDKI